MYTKARKLVLHIRPHRSLSSSRSFATRIGNRPVLGIRREDPVRIWERRCPLTPEAVHQLVHDTEAGVDVLVQPCERRVFKDEEFVKAGATLHPTLEPANVIIGIKETPLSELITSSSLDGSSRTQVMFSHTHKGQLYNMPLLSRFLSGDSASEKSVTSEVLLPTLLDWELLTDEKGKRSVGFGWFAGVAGALEGLVSTAHLHLSLGVASPFLGTPRPHTAPLASTMRALRGIGDSIAVSGTPRSIGPFIVAVTGSGQVSAGALDLLRQTLPVEEVTVERLPVLIKDPNTPLNKIYLIHATQETYLFHNSTDAPATRSDYYTNPSSYDSHFHDLIAPYATLLINGVGWSTGFPRLMSLQQTAQALQKVQEIQAEINSRSPSGLDLEGSLVADRMKGRCQSFADVSCDIQGGLEFLTRHSTLSDPSFSIDLASSFPSHPSSTFLAGLPPLQMMSVDILPTALPLEASESFSEGVLPYLKALCERYRVNRTGQSAGGEGGTGRVEEALRRAVIAEGGKLKGKHEGLQKLVDDWRTSTTAQISDSEPRMGSTEAALPEPKAVTLASSSTSTSTKMPLSTSSSWTTSPHGVHRKRILLLGSGMVAGPAVEEISRRADIDLVIASDQSSRLEELSQGRSNVSTVFLDGRKPDAIGELVKQADIVISLLPVPMHPVIAELCIKHRKHMITASYISPEMKTLSDRASAASTLILNEVGLDPGIDHCSTLSLLARLRSNPQRKKALSYSSFCGGLPAPECAEGVPLRYKFSWSPRGVLGATLNGARFLLDGKEVRIPADDLLVSYVPSLPVSSVLALEGLPNRDSTTYEGVYSLLRDEGVRTVFRGTIRYPGFSSLLHAFKAMGLLDTSGNLELETYGDLFRRSVSRTSGTPISAGDNASFLSAVRDIIPSAQVEEVGEAISFLTSSGEEGLPVPEKGKRSAIDHFASLLAHKLAYKPGERDLVLMHHEVVTSSATEGNEAHTSTLAVYGTPKHSAMALTVGLPVALAALRVLDARSSVGVGVKGPIEPAMYEHILKGLEERGVQMTHSSRRFGGCQKLGKVENALVQTFA